MTYEQCLGLTGEKWVSLEEDEKIEILQTIENHMAIESSRKACTIVGCWLYTGEDGIVLGAYSRETQTIFINTSQLDPDSKFGRDPDRIITTCIHEGRHAYQNQVVSGLIRHDNLEEAEQWSENLSEDNYITYQENPVAYYMQPVEVDARTFAEERMLQLLEERALATYKADDMTVAKHIFEHQMSEEQNKGLEVACVASDSVAMTDTTGLKNKIN